MDSDEEIRRLQERIFELERVVNAMAGYVEGFGTSGVWRVRMAAKRQIAAARAAEEDSLRERLDLMHKPAEH